MNRDLPAIAPTIRATIVDDTLTVSTIVNNRGFIETCIFGDVLDAPHMFSVTSGTERIHEQHEAGIRWSERQLAITRSIAQTELCECGNGVYNPEDMAHCDACQSDAEYRAERA